MEINGFTKHLGILKPHHAIYIKLYNKNTTKHILCKLFLIKIVFNNNDCMKVNDEFR